MRHSVALALLLLLVAACSHDPSPRAVSSRAALGERHDPLVTVFRSDRSSEWRQFRLGGGLNVVVENANLLDAPQWRAATGAISSSPTVMGTTLLISANDDRLYAFDAATGALRWRYSAENEVMSQPAYARGLVYIGVGNSDITTAYPPHISYVGSGISKLEAIDARTGIERWRGGLDGTGMPSPAIVGDAVIEADGNGTVVALDARSGAYRWDRQLATTFSMTSVASSGGATYMTGRFENAVYAVEAASGRLLWRHRFSAFVGGLGDDPLASTRNALVGIYLAPLRRGPFGMAVTAGSVAREHVFALDKGAGRLLWDTQLVADSGVVQPYNQAAISLIYGSTIYVGSAVAPFVTALDMRGHMLWQTRVGGVVKGGIAALGGVLYFGDHSGRLWAVSARTGRAIGSVATDMVFNTGSPIIVNGSLIEGGIHDVIALPLANIRASLPIRGITSLTAWQRFTRF